MNEGVHPKASILNRFIAKAIDLLIAGALLELLPGIGFLAGILYLLIADGLFQGKSAGKWLISLQVYVPPSRSVCGFKESIIRNAPMALAYLFLLIPYVGWVLTACILAVEALVVIGNELGLRIGDEMAGTQVLDCKVLNAEAPGSGLQ